MPLTHSSKKMVRTRFAPSPTGDLHIGGVRTALFSWLFARHYQGRFILRIEDTDRARSTPEAIQAILEGMRWLGIDYDEGPYFQSQRLDRYQEVLTQLLETGAAYRCYCSVDRLNALRAEQTAQRVKPRYDGHCRHNRKVGSPAQLFVIRFCQPTTGQTEIIDHIHGPVAFKNSELDDFILARSDGTPTYNFTVVVDDYDMQITHVIRGDDHLNNTPRQVNVLKALNALVPQYTHVPMLHGDNGKKLSKREGAANVLSYREAGYLPEALSNYLVRLGWSHGDQEIFSQEELIRYFDGSHLSKSPAIFNQDKLLWLNQHYLKEADTQRVAKLIQPFLHPWSQQTPDVQLEDIIQIQKERTKTLKDMAQKSQFFYQLPDVHTIDISETLITVIQAIYPFFSSIERWEREPIQSALEKVLEQHPLSKRQVFQSLRMVLTGGTVSPPLESTLKILGRDRVLQQLNQIIEIGKITSLND